MKISILERAFSARILLTVCLFAAFVPGVINKAAAGDVPMPDNNLAVSLIYETIITLNNAARADNYSVLRDLASPAFQKKYRTEDLKQTFGALKERGVDLRPVILMQPTIEKSQFLKAKDLFRLKGYMATRPARLNFEIQYQYVGGAWRLYALDLRLGTPPAEAGAPPFTGAI